MKLTAPILNKVTGQPIGTFIATAKTCIIRTNEPALKKIWGHLQDEGIRTELATKEERVDTVYSLRKRFVKEFTFTNSGLVEDYLMNSGYILGEAEFEKEKGE